MPIAHPFPLSLLGPMGNEYADSMDMTIVVGLRPLTTGERSTSSIQNSTRNQVRDRE